MYIVYDVTCTALKEVLEKAARQLLSRHLLSATFAIEIFYRRTITTDMANLNETKLKLYTQIGIPMN